MEPIRIAWGTGRGPTELAAYDAALADAGAADYNLLRLSSVIPADVTVEEVTALPDLGPGGDALHVVEASAVGELGPQTAVLAWARSPAGAGVFYEAGDSAPVDDVRAEALTGLEAGLELRDRSFGDPETRSVSVDADAAEGHAAAVAIAAYGTSESLLE